MGFGAIIASGEKNTLLPDNLVSRITEVRVEQTLDDPIRYAIRFEDDICGGDFEVMYAEPLQCGSMIAIAVKVADKVKCLVRGPITDVHASFTLGGPGSWYQIRGEDRRVELDRTCAKRAWTVRASEAAEQILSPKFRTNIQTTSIVYGALRSEGRSQLETLNQPFTDSYFIRGIARDNNLHFWLDYDCRVAGDVLVITETANLKSSPPRPDSTTPDSKVKLVAAGNVKLRVNVARENCSNVNAFSLRMDAELPKTFSGTAIDDREVAPHNTTVADPQPAIQKNGRRLPGSQEDRNVCIITAGSPPELQARAESSLTAAGWFLHATASTTVYRLSDVLLPHDVIDVEGVGKVHEGAYQVTAVTHVINAADHFMDIELRRNAIGKN